MAINGLRNHFDDDTAGSSNDSQKKHLQRGLTPSSLTSKNRSFGFAIPRNFEKPFSENYDLILLGWKKFK